MNSSSYDGILLTNKGKNNWDTQQSGRITRELCWVKKPISKGHILPNSIYITFSKWKNYRHEEQISSFYGLEWGGGREGGRCDYETVVALCSDGTVLYPVVVIKSICTCDKIA